MQDNPRLQRLSITIGAVREGIVRELRASADGRAASGRTLSMTLELMEVLWAELRQLSEEHDRLHRSLGGAGAIQRAGK